MLPLFSLPVFSFLCLVCVGQKECDGFTIFELLIQLDSYRFV